MIDFKRLFPVLFILVVIGILFFLNSNNKSESIPNYDNGSLDSTFFDKEIKPELTPEQKINIRIQELEEQGWKRSEINNGLMPPCYNYTSRKSQIDNYLEVYVGGGTDVVLKLMDNSNNQCIRYVFINRNTMYRIKNIPEGEYYVKIAYGKDWYSKTEDGACIGVFLKSPLYERGEDIMDYNIISTAEGHSIPSYQLKLDVIDSNLMNAFDSEEISVEEFNK
jgi:hypothetical protein